MIKIVVLLKEVYKMVFAIVLFILAGIAEIGGGYLIWQWLREGKPYYWGIFGGIGWPYMVLLPLFKNSPHLVEYMQRTGESLLSFRFSGDGVLIKRRLISMIGSELSSV